MPSAKFRKTPGSNVNTRDFAKGRGEQKFTNTKNIKLTKAFFKSQEKIKVSRKDLIPAKEWQFYLGDLVQVVAGRLTMPEYPKFLQEDKRQGKVLEMDFTRNLLRVEGIYLTRKHTAGSLFMAPMTYDLYNWIHYSNLALVDPSTQKPTSIKWEKVDSKWTRIAVDSNTTIPLPIEHKNRNLNDADSSDKSKLTPECSTKKQLDLTYDSQNGSDVAESCFAVKGHY